MTRLKVIPAGAHVGDGCRLILSFALNMSMFSRGVNGILGNSSDIFEQQQPIYESGESLRPLVSPVLINVLLTKERRASVEY